MRGWYPPQVLQGRMTSSPTYQRGESLESRSSNALPNLRLLLVIIIIAGLSGISGCKPILQSSPFSATATKANFEGDKIYEEYNEQVLKLI